MLRLQRYPRRMARFRRQNLKKSSSPKDDTANVLSKVVEDSPVEDGYDGELLTNRVSCVMQQHHSGEDESPHDEPTNTNDIVDEVDEREDGDENSDREDWLEDERDDCVSELPFSNKGRTDTSNPHFSSRKLRSHELKTTLSSLFEVAHQKSLSNSFSVTSSQVSRSSSTSFPLVCQSSSASTTPNSRYHAQEKRKLQNEIERNHNIPRILSMQTQELDQSISVSTPVTSKMSSDTDDEDDETQYSFGASTRDQHITWSEEMYSLDHNDPQCCDTLFFPEEWGSLSLALSNLK